MANRGKIFTFTVINVAAEDFVDKVPYAIAIVDDGEKKALAQIEGYKEGMDINVGMEVEFFKLNEDGKPLYRFI